MKDKKFFDERHARTYLIGSIIRLKNEPIMVTDLQSVEERKRDKEFKLIYSDLGSLYNKIVFLPNVRIDMNPVPLGMMDTDEETFYVQRNPSRGWKIGLCSENISYHKIEGKKMGNIRTPRGHDRGLRLSTLSLYNCIMGKYPSYTKALKSIIEGDRHSIAFSRKFAIHRGGLVYKSIDDTVGICERDKPILFDHFQYLNEVLTEDLEE